MRTVLITALVALALAVVPIASAAGGSGATSSGYSGQAGVQQTLGASTTQPKAAGTLPFTGVDLGIVVVAGIALVGMGVSLRRMSRRHNA